jgi:uncharacterized membrane protein
MGEQTARGRHFWWGAVALIALLGLALRVAAARGGFWTDEAWSMIYAQEARDAVGVFLRINHDNNHHLYTLWLQAVGMRASPLLARAPAILAGTLAIPVAALLFERRSRAVGLVAALLFAICPTLIVFGSEARGYAMMLLAALIMVLLVARAVEDRPIAGLRWWLALLALVGMFSHLTMAAPVVLLALWVYLERRGEHEASALADTLHLLGPALLAMFAVIAFVFTAAAISPTGMRLGGYVPFSVREYGVALDDLALWSAGLTLPFAWLMPVLVGATALWIGWARPPWLGRRARLYAILILGVPVGVAVIRSGNAGFPRYYLASVVGLLLLVAEWTGHGLTSKRPIRFAAAAMLAVLAGASLMRDAALIELQRGHPDGALADVAGIAPAGASVAADTRLSAILEVAAQASDYPLHIAQGCQPAQFALAAQRRDVASPAVIRHCGAPMRAIDATIITPLTGDAWILYRAETLQSGKPPVSGPLRTRGIAVLSGRAGVAQG